MGGFNRDIAGFRRLEIPVKSCRISKSDLQFHNGCKMLKQVQHDKFYGKPASSLEGEAMLLLFTYANRPSVRGGAVSVSIREPDRGHGVESAIVRVASVPLLTGPQVEAANSAT